MRSPLKTIAVVKWYLYLGSSVLKVFTASRNSIDIEISLDRSSKTIAVVK